MKIIEEANKKALKETFNMESTKDKLKKKSKEELIKMIEDKEE